MVAASTVKDEKNSALDAEQAMRRLTLLESISSPPPVIVKSHPVKSLFDKNVKPAASSQTASSNLPTLTSPSNLISASLKPFNHRPNSSSTRINFYKSLLDASPVDSSRSSLFVAPQLFEELPIIRLTVDERPPGLPILLNDEYDPPHELYCNRGRRRTRFVGEVKKRDRLQGSKPLDAKKEERRDADGSRDDDHDSSRSSSLSQATSSGDAALGDGGKSKKIPDCDFRAALVMELMPKAKSLSVLISEGSLSVRDAIYIFREVARGLNYLHNLGIVHLDVKSPNVVLSPPSKIASSFEEGTEKLPEDEGSSCPQLESVLSVRKWKVKLCDMGLALRVISQQDMSIIKSRGLAAFVEGRQTGARRVGDTGFDDDKDVDGFLNLTSSLVYEDPGSHPVLMGADAEQAACRSPSKTNGAFSLFPSFSHYKRVKYEQLDALINPSLPSSSAVCNPAVVSGSEAAVVGIVGSHGWIAPEILRAESAILASDVYSFGVLIWETITGCVPFSELGFNQLCVEVGFGLRRLRPIREMLDLVKSRNTRKKLRQKHLAFVNAMWKERQQKQKEQTNEAQDGSSSVSLPKFGSSLFSFTSSISSEQVPVGLCRLQEACCHFDPRKRPSIGQVAKALDVMLEASLEGDIEIENFLFG
eukprot:GDKK01047283.1.p1 GENE.GDKK01047283.1~~GDKK01047283.1.p1  ORF type:complete len:657 (-),score=149.07 GDKK01047283.1:53-1990(-)